MVRVSLIVPVCNAAPSLARCLSSVLAQSLRELEAVCVDDGSTDSSGAILADFAARDSRVRVISQPNRGTLMARQAAVRAATGEWCFFLDPDDTLEPTACEKMLAAVEAAGADLAVCGFHIRQGLPISERHAKAVDDYFNAPQAVMGRAELFTRCFVERSLSWGLIGKMVRGALCRESFAGEVRAYAIESEDIYSLFRIAARVGRAVVVPDRLYSYTYSLGISTKPQVDKAEFARSMGKLGLARDLRDFCAVSCGDVPTARAALEAVEWHMVRSQLVTIAERMHDRPSREESFALLASALGGEALARALARLYERNPFGLAKNLSGFWAPPAHSGERPHRIAALLPASPPQRTVRLFDPIAAGLRARGLAVVELRDGDGLPADGLPRVDALMHLARESGADAVVSFRCDSVAAVWDAVAVRIGLGLPAFLCHHGDFTSAMYSHPTVTLYNYEPYWLALFDGVFTPRPLDAAVFAAEGARAFAMAAGAEADAVASALEGRAGEGARRAISPEELSEVLSVQRRALESLHERRSSTMERLRRERDAARAQGADILR